MSKFQELYNADIARYGGKPELYIKIFLFLYRKAATASFAPTKFYTKPYFDSGRIAEVWNYLLINRLGGGLYLGHAYNITINCKSKIGRNCNIHKGVVIGQVNRGSRKGYPTIGDRVWIGINSAIVGNVTIGDDVMIAPNSFVNIDIPSHSVVFGNPCVIKHRDWATEGYVNNIVE